MTQQIVTHELRDFEVEIIKNFQLQGKLFVSPKAEWIHGHLQDVGQDYGTSMFKQWSAFCEASKQIETREGKKPAGIKPGSYNAFMTYLWLLHNKLGLLRLSKVVNVRPNVSRKFQRRYYELDAARLDDPSWRHPFQSVYVSSDWSKMKPEERRHHRKKWRERRPKKKRGAPAKHSYGIERTEH